MTAQLPAARVALRQHAEAALAAVEAALGDTLLPAAREEALAGIAAVLPAPADRATEERIEQAEADAEQQARNTLAVANERESYRKAWKDEQQRRVKAEAAVTRVRRLHDALDEETALTSPDDEITRGAAARKIAAALDGWTDPAALRRMADETATTETPFTPPAHYRRDDGVDCCVHAIPVGPDSCPACRELADDQPAAGPTIVDQVVVALQVKAQALSVEAEEEMRRDLEEQAQVWHEAAELARRTGRKVVRSAQPAAGARQDGAESTALDVLRCLADPEACRWEGVYCVTHSWKSDIGRCPHGQAQALISGGTATEVLPRRGDQFEAWLKAQRDSFGWQGSNDRRLYDALDGILDRYRLHADTGTPLDEHVCEGQAVGDCECLEQPAVSPPPA